MLLLMIILQILRLALQDAVTLKPLKNLLLLLLPVLLDKVGLGGVEPNEVAVVLLGQAGLGDDGGSHCFAFLRLLEVLAF